MAGGNISPRQKMINMMYLVLTAMLALNVSAEILKAFHKVEVSMNKAGVNVNEKNVMTLKSIESYHSKNAGDVIGTDIYNKSLQCKKIADEGVKYVSDLKNVLIEQADGRKEKDPNGELEKPDNIELHANYLIIQGNGAKLKQKIDETKSKLMALVPAKDKAVVKSDLNTEVEKGSSQSWESEEFEHTPLAAVVALLSKTENDIKNTESQILDLLKAGLTDDVVIVNNFNAKVIPNNGTYITTGSEYSADIFLAASTRQEADIKVGSMNIPVEDGVGKYKITASGEGEKKYEGVITTKRSNGEILTYPFSGSYTSIKPIAVISATKMNVVYIGLENPISVSVPGYAAEEVQVSLSPASAGSLKPDKGVKGNYLLTLNRSASELTIVASVKQKGGSGAGTVKKMGEQKYRVRMIPDPIPALGIIDVSGGVPSALLKAQSVVRAPLKNFAFEGVNYIPYEYTFILVPKKGGNTVYEQGKGQQLSPSMQGAMSRAQKGDKIIISQIKVKGPDGNRQLPSPLVFDVQ